MAPYAEVLVGRRKPFQEKTTPSSDSQVETSEQAPDDSERQAIQAAAAAEERRAAELIAQAKAEQGAPTKAPDPVDEEESLVSIAAKGMPYLHQKLREHAARAQAKKEEYQPPPMTERQRQLLEAEQAAGQRARERHERELANRPPPPAREKWDGTNTPVMRPGGNVPDPMVPAPSGFAAGSRQFGAEV